jgi:hypothetical protein
MKWPFFRDLLLFLGGMGGVIHETILSHAERPTLLILFAAMMGLPAFLQPRMSDDDKDEKDRKELRELRSKLHQEQKRLKELESKAGLEDVE